MKIEVCDPELMISILDEFYKMYSKPRLVTDNIPFKFEGDNTPYAINTNMPMFNLMEVIDKFILDKGFDKQICYLTRISSMFKFIKKNKDHLQKLDLVRSTKIHSLHSYSLLRAAATCKIGSKGFEFQDMMEEIQKYESES